MKLRFLSLIFTMLLGLGGFAQFSASYNIATFPNVGVGYEFCPRFWGEVRMYTDFAIEDFTAEPLVAFNYVMKDNFNLYIGAGCNLNEINGPAFPIGVQFMPFDDKNLRLSIEAEPTYLCDEPEGSFNFYGSLGIKYVLGNRK